MRSTGFKTLYRSNSDKEFFNGRFEAYEESSGYNNEEISDIKKDYVDGNTAIFREIVKLINGKRENIKVYSKKYDNHYEIQLDNNCLVVYDCFTNETFSFDVVKNVEDIRSVINYITEEYLPINPIILIQ